MPFQQATLSFIHQEICQRRDYLGRLARVEFDDEEYKALLNCGRRIIRSYEEWAPQQKEKARTVFLAFACEYVRRKKPTGDNVFWDDFAREVGLPREHLYGLVSNELLWKAYEENGISQKKGAQNRLIVESLVSEVNASEADTEDCINFFCWYYHRYAGTKEITSELLAQYRKNTKQTLEIHEKAIPTFHQDCQLLTHIIEYAIENSLLFTSQESQIVENLGENCDLTRIHFVRNPNQLKKLFTRLGNYVTPSQFLEILQETGSSRSHILPPRGHRVSISLALTHWPTRQIPYGLYSLDGVDYRVVPQPWVSLVAIAEWPDKQIVTLRRGFVGYKKSEHFAVHVGERSLKSRECFLETGKSCYVWLGEVSKGEPLLIDGLLCPSSEGATWTVSLTMGFKDGNPCLLLRCDALKAFFPLRPKAPVTITTSQNHKWEGYLSSTGQLKKNRSIVFPLEPAWKSLSLALSRENQIIDQKQVQIESACLFSAQTFERIPNGSTREGAGREYYLFTLVLDQLIYDPQSLEIELLDKVWGDYAIYRIIWENDSPFKLQAGGYSWNIVKRSYFLTQILASTSKEPFRFTNYQLQQFSEASLYVYSNIDISASSIDCQVLFKEQQVFQTNLCSYLDRGGAESHSYTVRLQFFEDLDRVVGELLREERYGHYEFFFYRDARLLDTATLTLLPPLEILTDINQLVGEQESLPITMSTSPSLLFWNTVQDCLHSTTTLFMYPSIKRAISQLDAQYPGVFGFLSKEVTASIVFPSIGDSVEIAVRPVVFGVRLYQRQQVGKKMTDYTCVETGDYYSLQQTVVYVFTRPGALVSLFHEGKCLQQRRADNDGNLLLTELNAVRQECKRQSTQFEVSSEGQTSSFTIRWIPVVYTCHAEDGRVVVDMDGPRDSSVVVDIVDADQTVLVSFLLSCRGERFVTSFSLPLLEGVASQGYIIPRYALADGTSISGIKQWRIPLNPKGLTVPDAWLQAGIGFSSDELFTSLVLDR